MNDFDAFFEGVLNELMPDKMDVQWISRFVDIPRFEWDIDSLNTGFMFPARESLATHPERIRPRLAAELMTSLGADYKQRGPQLAALEMLHIASLITARVHNVKSHGEVPARDVLPTPVLVTVAYSLRQLALVLIFRNTPELSSAKRTWLGWRFSRIFCAMSHGVILDLWGDGTNLRHQDAAALAEHVRVFNGPLTFSLPCDAASAAANLRGDKVALLSRAGTELGLAFRIARMLAAKNNGRRSEENSGELPVRWQTVEEINGFEGGLEAQMFKAIDQAENLAHSAVPGAGEVMRRFFTDTTAQIAAKDN